MDCNVSIRTRKHGANSVRTGYPKIYEIVNNESGGVISTSIQIRRVPFPYSEYLGNKDEVEKAIKLLNGPDTGATRLWWDLADK